MHIDIEKAKVSDISDLIELFSKYLQFYNVQLFSDDDLKIFLIDRITKRDSEILIAKMGDTLVGFAQLYPTYSSLSLKKQWILNDLFVNPAHRKKGVADKLIKNAERLSIETNSKGLTLLTGVDNIKAQRLYERNGWKRSKGFFSYFKNHQINY